MDNELVDTEGKFVILVCDLSNRIFVDNGMDSLGGVKHHTSFADGRPVLVAGTIKVSNGDILYLDSDSGHYWTSPEVMRNFLTLFPQIPDHAVVVPDMTMPKRYYVKDYRERGMDAAALQGWQNDQSMGVAVTPFHDGYAKNDEQRMARGRNTLRPLHVPD